MIYKAAKLEQLYLLAADLCVYVYLNLEIITGSKPINTHLLI